MLQLSENGLNDLVKESENGSLEVKEVIQYMEYLSFSEALDFLISHPHLFQTPIITNDHTPLIGYNENEIRKFLPKEYRRYRLKI